MRPSLGIEGFTGLFTQYKWFSQFRRGTGIGRVARAHIGLKQIGKRCDSVTPGIEETISTFQAMSVERMIASFKVGDQLLNLKRSDFDSTSDRIKEHLSKGEITAATAVTFALLRVAGESALWELRRRGVFRISRYRFSDAPCHIVAAIQQIAARIQMTVDALKYLSSLEAMYSLRAGLKSLNDEVISILVEKRRVVSKSILGTLERLFFFPWPGGNVTLPGDNPLHHSTEDLAEAASWVLAVLRDEVGIQSADWYMPDEEELAKPDNIYLRVLLTVSRLNQFRHTEVLIDGLPYEAFQDGDDVIVQSCPDDLEKTVRLGYAQQEIQAFIRLQEFPNWENAKKFQPRADIVRQLYNELFASSVKIEEKPIARVTFPIPLDEVLIAYLSHVHPFLEEMGMLLQLDVDYLDGKANPNSEIVGGVTVIDIIRIQRLFDLLSWIYVYAVKQLVPEPEHLALLAQSSIFVMKKAHVEMLLELAIPEERVLKAIDLLLMPAGSDYVDLQYTPLIDLGNYVAGSAAVIARSNLVRNVQVAKGLHKGWPTGQDPMILELRDELKSAGFNVEIEVKFPFGKDLDGDVVAFRDGTLFLFECKHAYHPCSNHELRNVYAHIEKAATQLNQRAPSLLDPIIQKKLFTSLGWPSAAVTRVCVAIVTSTRVFHGLTLSGHRVVQIHALINAIARGELRVPGGAYSFWRGDAFCTDDLVDYLDGKTVIQDELDSMMPRKEVQPYGTRRLVRKTWTFDMNRGTEIAATRYRFTPDDASAQTS